MKHPALALMLAVLAPVTAAQAADVACLRGDGISHISMSGPDTAVATDKQNHRFAVVFAAPCGVRHQNVFFIMKPESMPQCVGPGTALPTNREGVCMVKAVEKMD